MFKGNRVTIISLSALCLLTGCTNQYTATTSTTYERHDSECADSPILVSMPGSYKCQVFDKSTATGTDGRPFGGMFQRFNVYGTATDGETVSLQLFMALGGRSYVTYDPANTSGIQAFNDAAKTGRNWSALRTVRRVSVMDFVAQNNRNCFGFHYGGGYAFSGYQYTVRGVVCRPVGQPQYTNEQIEQFFNQIDVKA